MLLIKATKTCYWKLLLKAVVKRCDKTSCDNMFN